MDDENENEDRLDGLFEMPEIVLIGETGLQNVIDQVRYILANHDGDEAIIRARFSLRTIAAVLPRGENDALTVAWLSGFLGTSTMAFVSALTATGKWSGEMGFEKLQAFLVQCIAFGEHPADLAKRTKVPDDEYKTLALLLDLENHWRDTIPDRVFLAVMGGESNREIRRIARCNRRRARRWRKWANGASAQMFG